MEAKTTSGEGLGLDRASSRLLEVKMAELAGSVFSPNKRATAGWKKPTF
eukprot:CAMPEP_0185919804 /NCGR_PEP_ID=MMETSP0924C-20121207/7303_1 /TAXON_ID=321610 /ORGANISM="Perkinsus chesapeaki, Strain ATCC PRA-65" /LENGTH=48 /DNA_ID= /DNA_START= /DNA_END= /DNA_ORIENTATION=